MEERELLEKALPFVKGGARPDHHAEELARTIETALEAAAPAGTAHDVHWAIKADCARCRERYPQRHAKPDYIPNFGNVEAGDWTHPTTAEHDWRYCQAAKIHEALFLAALATPSPQPSVASTSVTTPRKITWFCRICERDHTAYCPAVSEENFLHLCDHCGQSFHGNQHECPAPAATQEQPAWSGAVATQPISKRTHWTEQMKTDPCVKEPGSPRKVGEDGARSQEWLDGYAQGCGDMAARPSSVPVGEQKPEEGV